DRRLIGHYPALVAPILGPEGDLQSAHRIYDAVLEPRKKSLPAVNTISGGAVRLFEPDEELGIAEGIETALAAHEMFRVPVWAALTSNGVKSFVPPLGGRRLHVLSDNNSTFVGEVPTYTLAQSL